LIRIVAALLLVLSVGAGAADTPTMAELGTKDLTFIGWFGLPAPAGTPQDILDKLNAEAKTRTGRCD
jgi:tripartite-type tricarboxylate transporter receptor subunit TctC